MDVFIIRSCYSIDWSLFRVRGARFLHLFSYYRTCWICMPDMGLIRLQLQLCNCIFSQSVHPSVFIACERAGHVYDESNQCTLLIFVLMLPGTNAPALWRTNDIYKSLRLTALSLITTVIIVIIAVTKIVRMIIQTMRFFENGLKSFMFHYSDELAWYSNDKKKLERSDKWSTYLVQFERSVPRRRYNNRSICNCRISTGNRLMVVES